jgi:hypothetical protein
MAEELEATSTMEAVNTEIEQTPAGEGEGAGEGTGLVPAEEAGGEGTTPESEPAARAEGEPEAPEPKPAPEPPKEMLPGEIVRAIKEMKGANPQHATALAKLRDAYFSTQAYKGIYRTVEDAKVAKAWIDAVGGFDGINYLQRLNDRMTEIDEMIERGDTRAFDEMASASPEGFKKLAAHGLRMLQRMDVNAYQQALLGPIVETLESSGVNGALARALEELRSATPDGVARAQRELAALAGWVKSLQEAEAGIRNRYQDPKLHELEQREASVREQQGNMLKEHVKRDLTAYMNVSVRQSVQPLIRDRGLTAQAVDDLVNGAMDEIVRNLGENKFYQTSMRSLLAKRDIGRIVDFAKAQIDQVRHKSVQSVWSRRYSTAAPARQTKPAGTANGAGTNNQPASSAAPNDKPIPIARKPAPHEIDWAKDPDRLLYIAHRAYLKGSGKLVTWKVGSARA